MIIKSISNNSNITKYFTKYYRTIKITNNESNSLSDFQICLELDTDFCSQADPNNF